MKKKLSISDIAKSLNISVTTVSFILNGRAEEKRIRKELVQKVLEYIEEVGYKPNSLARSLRTGKSNIIGLMVEDISNPFFADIARLIEENAYTNGYKIFYSSTDNDPGKSKELIQIYKERHVDGYIIAPSEGIEDDISALVSSGYPVVLFDRTLPGLVTDYVGIDNYNGTFNAVSHLIERGYRNIGFVTLFSPQSQMQQRLQGYRDAMLAHGISGYIREIRRSKNTINIINEVSDFIEEQTDLEAVLFGTNYLAVSGLKAIYSLGLKIPSDLAVIAFDDHDLFELSNPSITVIKQPVAEIAHEVINVLLNNLQSPLRDKKTKSIVLSTSLTVRHSTTFKGMTV